MQVSEKCVDGLKSKRQVRRGKGLSDRINTINRIGNLRLVAMELQGFEGGFAEVAVFEVDLTEFGFGDVGGGAKDVADDGPAELKGFVFSAGEGRTGEPDGGGGEGGAFEVAKVVCEDFGLLE